MLDRITRGFVPPRPHTVVKASDGRVLYEECLTRDGFDGPFSILYHRYRPHEAHRALMQRLPGYLRRHLGQRLPALTNIQPMRPS